MDNQFIDDVLCTALDSAYGGSLYWVERTSIKNGNKADYGVECKYEVVSKGGVLVVISDEGEVKELDRAKFEKAIRQWFVNWGIPVNVDAGDIDADDADAILQIALFGEVVYS